MNRTDLVAAVANHTGRSRKDVDEVLRGFTDVVTTVVAKGEAVAISGFAKFEKVDRPARMGRNPQTGDPVKIKASKKPKVTPLKGFKDSVVKPSQAPKLTRGTFPLSDAAKSGGTARSAASGTAKAGTAKKSAAKKTTTKKAAAKKTTAKKSAAKKTTARKAPAKKATSRS